jgi:hypothetical protein
VSYPVRLKLRLENLKQHNVPKRCSSCFRKPAPERRIITAQHQINKKHRFQWAIQLPLCPTCYEMAEVLTGYRPSKHGPPQRARNNKLAALGLLVLSLLAIVAFILPKDVYIQSLGVPKHWVFGVFAVIFVGVYYWNYRANQRGQMAAYQALVDRAGYPFGDVTIESSATGPILIFDNEDFGRAFEQANPDSTSPDSEDQAAVIEPVPETMVDRFVDFLTTAFRIN